MTTLIEKVGLSAMRQTTRLVTRSSQWLQVAIGKVILGL